MPLSLELHGARTGNCLRTAVALEETGLAYTLRPLNLAAGPSAPSGTSHSTRAARCRC